MARFCLSYLLSFLSRCVVAINLSRCAFAFRFASCSCRAVAPSSVRNLCLFVSKLPSAQLRTDGTACRHAKTPLWSCSQCSTKRGVGYPVYSVKVICYFRKIQGTTAASMLIIKLILLIVCILSSFHPRLTVTEVLHFARFVLSLFTQYIYLPV